MSWSYYAPPILTQLVQFTTSDPTTATDSAVTDMVRQQNIRRQLADNAPWQGRPLGGYVTSASTGTHGTYPPQEALNSACAADNKPTDTSAPALPVAQPFISPTPLISEDIPADSVTMVYRPAGEGDDLLLPVCGNLSGPPRQLTTEQLLCRRKAALRAVEIAIAQALQQQADDKAAAAGNNPLLTTGVKRAVLVWVNNFPAITNPEGIVDNLCANGFIGQNAAETAAALAQSMEVFAVAGILTAEAPELVFEQLQAPFMALQALLIFRRNLVRVTSDEAYQQTVKKLDSLIHHALSERYAQPLKQATGLDIDLKRPSYASYHKLTEISTHKEPVTALEAGILDYAARHPDEELDKLIRLDNWLATGDTDTVNMVIWCLGGALLETFMDISRQLDRCPAQPSQPQPPVVRRQQHPSQPHRVRFTDQPLVIPSDGARSAQQPVADIVPLSRSDMACHLSRQYFDLLGDALRKLEVKAQAGDQNCATLLLSWRGIAQASCTTARQLASDTAPLPSQSEAHQEAVTEQENMPRGLTQVIQNSIDNYMTAIHPQSDLFTPQGRASQLAELSFVKSGLVDKKRFIQTYEQHLSNMIIKTLRPRKCSIRGTNIVQYEFTQSPNPAPGKDQQLDSNPPLSSHLMPDTSKTSSGKPRTSELMLALSETTRPFHQAMEVDLNDPVGLCQDLMVIDDPRLMIALRVRMERENATPLQLANWQERMKQVVKQHCFERVYMTMDHAISQAIQETIKQEREKNPEDRTFQGEQPDLDNPKELAKVESFTRAAYSKLITALESRPMEQWIRAIGYDHRIADIWANGLNKPTNWPVSLDRFVLPYLPEPGEIVEALRAQSLANS